MQFDADHLFALAGYAESDSDTMANHIRTCCWDVSFRK